MNDYRVINDNGYGRTWEELYEDNVRFQKYTDKLENQQKEFIDYLEKEIVDSKSGSSQQHYAKEHLLKFKEINHIPDVEKMVEGKDDNK